MILKRLKITNFKGVSDQEISFKNRTTISGENATGKTTIADAWYWLMTGRDSNLVDNPAVIPLGATEANPTVEAELDIDGKTVTVRKVQTYKAKDGKESTTNQYLVNEVPMAERDFKKKLEDYGVDTEKFLVLSHPDNLLKDTSKKNREYIRNQILFPMAESKTDKELAKKAKLKELCELLDKYTLNEIEAMQKATLAKIDKEIGKDNKIANARIDELMRGKANLNEKEIAAQLKSVTTKLTKAENTTDTYKQKCEEIKAEIMQAKFDLNAVSSDLKAEAIKMQNELETLLVDARNELSQFERRKADIERQIEAAKRAISDNAERAEFLNKRNEQISTEEFDEDSGVCPMCGRPFEKDKIDEMRQHFEDDKAQRLRDIYDEIEEIASDSGKKSEDYDRLQEELDELVKYTNEANTKVSDLIESIENIVIPDAEDTDEYKELNKKIKTLEKNLAKIEEAVVKSKEDAKNLELEHDEIKGQMRLVERDKQTDERIAEIRTDIRQAEINRANAEKIIYQMAELNKVKNASLEESINKHFRLVKWRLFKTLKNGNYEDDCTPVIDGFELWKAANKGREILAKLDIIDGLSKFYDQSYPVFLDNSESLSSVTEDRVDMSNQLVMFKVSEDKELKID